MNHELIDNLLLHAGVVVFDETRQYTRLLSRLNDKFLTDENKAWFEARSQSRRKSGFSMCPKKEYLIWELFSFERLKANKNQEAINAFERLKITSCYTLQLPNYSANANIRPSFRLSGEYDVSYINNQEEFDLLKEQLKKSVPIPYWVVDSIAREEGDELYLFDEEFKWLLVLTHEEEVYFYQET